MSVEFKLKVSLEILSKFSNGWHRCLSLLKYNRTLGSSPKNLDGSGWLNPLKVSTAISLIEDIALLRGDCKLTGDETQYQPTG